MAKGRFHVRDTFEKRAPYNLILVGSLVTGEIHPDMFIRVPFKPGRCINLLVTGIEFDCDDPNDEYELSIQAGPNMIEILRALALKGQTFDVEDFSDEG